MKNLLLLILFPLILFSQQNEFDESLFINYENFKEFSLKHKKFKHEDIQPIIENIKLIDGFSVKELGHSVEGRSISLISVGKGSTDILLWSQMHGDESTATMAIFDILNYLKSNKKILNHVTLHFIPMLNPDGAELFQRRNALGIDINRDAIRLQSPESRILKFVRDSIQAEFGFNLHDQSKYYNARGTDKPATISYLAPAYDFDKNIDKIRANAMKIIVEMNKTVQKYAPGQVGRYSDEFEPRAFGDNIQKWGTSTILIESGGQYDDPEKQFIRKLNYVSILTAIASISTKSFESNSIKEYESIPRNDSKLFDLKLTNITYPYLGKKYTVDIGINFINAKNPDAMGKKIGIIRDIGDLSTYYGYKTIDAKNLEFKNEKTYPKILSSIDDFEKLKLHDLLEQGYTTVAFDQLPEQLTKEGLPVKIISIKSISITRDNMIPKPPIQFGKTPTFLLTNNDQIVYTIIDGNVSILTK